MKTQTKVRAHPRVCGENPLPVLPLIRSLGSPPRVRGKRTRIVTSIHQSRLTPACAGKTQIISAPANSDAAHPRVCGENYWKSASKGHTPWLTPACAGKTLTAGRLAIFFKAHPRVCGENPKNRKPLKGGRGSPPRVRGKHNYCVQHHTAQRLTPACAGKT